MYFIPADEFEDNQTQPFSSLPQGMHDTNTCTFVLHLIHVPSPNLCFICADNLTNRKLEELTT